MRFQLPQFIHTEIKVIGPFTIKQFLWIAAGGAIIFLLSSLTHGFIFYALALPIAAVAIALAFLKIDDQPLMNYIGYGLSYLLGQKRYVFKGAPQNNPSEMTKQQPK